MQIIRGTTPTIIVNVRSDINLSQITNVWAYIYQQGNIIIDKQLTDVTIDTINRKIIIPLSQENTLALKADTGALFQIRLFLLNGTALATVATNIIVQEVYKNGVISGGT